MLKHLAGADLARPVVWMGPTAFEGRTARVMGPRINAIMKREVEAFEGNAVFVDVYKATRKPNGKMVTQFQAPDRKAPEGLRGHDGIHLTARAVKYLMAEPALKPLEPCFTGHLAEWKKAEEVRAAERRKKAKELKAERARLRAERKAQRIKAYQEKLEKKRQAKAARLEARRLRMAKKKGLETNEKKAKPANSDTPKVTKTTAKKPKTTVTEDGEDAVVKPTTKSPVTPKPQRKPDASEKSKKAHEDRATKPNAKLPVGEKPKKPSAPETGAKE